MFRCGCYHTYYAIFVHHNHIVGDARFCAYIGSEEVTAAVGRAIYYISRCVYEVSIVIDHEFARHCVGNGKQLLLQLVNFVVESGVLFSKTQVFSAQSEILRYAVAYAIDRSTNSVR
jgi:hypothetical protein